MNEEVLRLENIYKSYPTSSEKLEILKGVNLTLLKGESISILGQSGSGKSTLLYVSALLLKKDSGKIYYSSLDSDTAKGKEIEKLRNKSMGFLFQNSSLLLDFSSLENVMLPLLISGYKKKDAKERAESALNSVGLYNRRNHFPSKLSGGEKSRVALCRAVINSPDVLFLDEPTGSLDEKTSREIEELILSFPKERNISVLLVTHNVNFSSLCDKRYILEDGVLHNE